MEVAGAGGVEEDGPGDVAVVLGAHLLLFRPADDVGVEEEVLEGGLHHVPVHVFEDVHDEAVHVVVRVLPEGGALDGEAVLAVAREGVHPVHDFHDVFFRVPLQVGKHGIERSFFQSLLNTHLADLLFYFS